LASRQRKVHAVHLNIYPLNRFEEAIKCLDRALEINSRHEFAWVYKGSALAMLERDTEAIECYNRALEIEPRNAEAWYNKAVCLNRMGRRHEALECIRKAIEIEPSLRKRLRGS
jgi:tetratricopeptide (TPR) repeat protein